MPSELRNYLFPLIVALLVAAAAKGAIALGALLRPARPDDSGSLFGSLRIVERGLLPAPLVRWLGWARASTVRVLPVCLDDRYRHVFDALFAPDRAGRLARLGVTSTERAEDATMVVVAGYVSPRSEAWLRELLSQVPQPRLVISMAPSGGGVDALPFEPIPLENLCEVDANVRATEVEPVELLEVLLAAAAVDRAADPAPRWHAAASAPLIAPPSTMRIPSVGCCTDAEVPLLEAGSVQGDGSVHGVVPVTGFAHRAVEALAEQVSLSDPVQPGARTALGEGDGGGPLAVLGTQAAASAVAVPWAFALAVEGLAQLDVPPEAERARALLGELSRVASTLDDLVAPADLLGFPRLAGQLRDVASRVSSHVIEAVEHHQVVPGGVAGSARDLTTRAGRWTADLAAAQRVLGRFLADVCDANAVRARTLGVGAVSTAQAYALCLSGVSARASGVECDGRAPGGIPLSPWSDAAWKVRSHVTGDVHARMWLRAIEGVAAVDVIERLSARPFNGAFLTPFDGHVPPGESSALVEHPHGLILCEIVGDGTPRPWRVHFASPAVPARSAVARLCEGARCDDVALIVASFAVSPSEADR